MSLVPYLHSAAAHTDLTSAEAYQAMSVILAGEASEALIGAFLVALKMKGETAAELAGFARAMRDKMIPVDCQGPVIDTAGTGGDHSGTFNISTAAAFIMAGAGAKVAKHGNRSLSSQTGSADVLEALGIRIAMTPEEAVAAVREIGIGFLFAPHLHPAMKFAQPVRRELKMRTAFNLLGPLCNPARAEYQLIGAPSLEAAKLMAEALCDLGTRRSFVVHGHDGLDEVSTTGPTEVLEVTPEGLTHHVWMPEDFGVRRTTLAHLQGGDAQKNASIINEILSGVESPARDIAVVNAGAGLFAAGLAPTLYAGVGQASQAIDSGAALATFSRLQKKFPVL